MGRAPQTRPRDSESQPLVSLSRLRTRLIVYAIIDICSRPDHPLGDAVETFVRREDAEREQEADGRN